MGGAKAGAGEGGASGSGGAPSPPHGALVNRVHGCGCAKFARPAGDDTWLVNSFRVMADPVRRRIVEILASGEHTAGNVAEVLALERSITRQAVSKHLRILSDNGWASVRPEESTRVYGLEADALARLYHDVAWLKYLWKRRIGERERNDPGVHVGWGFLEGRGR